MFARAFLVLVLLAAPAGHAETWSARDVEAAERYRALERERAERYRAAREREPEAPPERGAADTRAGEGGAGLLARLSDWLAARLGAWLGELLAELEGWLVRQLEALTGRLDERPPRRDFRFQVERERDPLGDWLAREEERARGLLEGLEDAAPRLEPEEWAAREAERAREWARREARRERGRRPAPWEERWREAESWERIERERALRHLEQGREWWREERERLEGR